MRRQPRFQPGARGQDPLSGDDLESNCAIAYRVATLVGDLATDNDAAAVGRGPRRRCAKLSTGTVCHLEAAMGGKRALADWRLDDLDLLFIENVGNLVCPANYDLGEELRLVLMSVTEGEDKPLKYPTIFNTADVAVLTKIIDLAEAVEFDAPRGGARTFNRCGPACRSSNCRPKPARPAWRRGWRFSSPLHCAFTAGG